MRLGRPAPEEPAPAPAKKSRPWLRRSLWTIVAVIVAAIVGCAAILGVAVLTPKPALFLAGGVVAFCLANALGVALVTKPVRRAGRITTYVLTTLIVLGAGVAAVVPRGEPREPARAVSGMRYWDLSTGSRLAYVKLPARGAHRATPLIVLHGGPGVADMAGEARYFRPLTRDGFDVYVYDQIGSGHSGRLSDPRGYTLARNVADLEAIRQTIGARRIALVGYSYGALLGAAYMAAHPAVVCRAVFASPADLDPAKFSASTFSRLSNSQIRGLVSQLVRPRALLAYGLLQVDPAAAHNFAGDAEMDARFDEIYRQSAAALHCKNDPLGPPLRGLGYYANQFPQSAAAAAHQDVRPALRRVATPTLIIKGSCDYLSWSSAIGYLHALPHASLEYVHNAGHDVFADQPQPVLALVRAFLSGRSLPQAPYAGTAKPDGYQGPD